VVFGANAHHLLGRYDEELELLSKARVETPTDLAYWRGEAAVLGALGRTDSVLALVTASTALENPNAPGLVMREAARELSAHGHQEAATKLWERYLAEYVARQPPPQQRVLAPVALAALGRFAEARSAMLKGSEPGLASFGWRARAVPLAIAAGDTTGAQAMLDSLEHHGVTIPGQITGDNAGTRAMVTRAEILSLLGRKAEAVAMLRTAMNNGHRLLRDAELNWAWAPLRDYPPFQALVKVRE
jgi:tetratricopeptide (TPR) repeat protein